MVDLTEIRAREPGRIADAWAARTRRPLLREDGRLLIVAADHPARGALGVRDDSMAMASRFELLDRLATAVGRPGVDGVLGTPDILDDLLLMGALDDRVVIGSMNRGGLQGASFEFDDRFTGYTAAEIEARGLEGGKMLTRVCLDDPGTVATLEASGRAVTELAQRRLMAMVEPFLSVRDGDRVQQPARRRQHHPVDPHRLRPRRQQRLHLDEAAGGGRPGARHGGDHPAHAAARRRPDRRPAGHLRLVGQGPGPARRCAAWSSGRALLFPPDGDVAAAVDIASELVHGAG